METTTGSLNGVRIGVARRFLEQDALHSDVLSVFERSLNLLKQAGATIVDIELPNANHGVATYYVLCAAEAASNLARYDGLRYGNRISKDTLLNTYLATREQGFGDEVKRRILLGTFVLRASSYEQYYGRAMKVRTLIAQDYTQAFASCDLIASPTSPTPGLRFQENRSDPLAAYLGDIFTVGANLAGLPAISIPAGFSQKETKLPIGFQLIGPRLGETKLLQVAASHEDQTNWHQQISPMVKEVMA